MKRLLLVMVTLAVLFNSGSSFATQRIVVAGGALTEIIYALGMGDDIVGVDLTSKYPQQTANLPKIGYWKLLNIEGILSLKPTLFVSWQDCEPTAIFKYVQASNVDLLTLPREPSSINQLISNINVIADKLGRKTQAAPITSSILQQMRELEKNVSTQTEKPRALLLLSMHSYMVAGKHTVADEIIRLAGGNNIAEHSSYRTFSAEALIAANPDVLIMTTQTVDKLGGIENLHKIPGIEQTNAWKNRRIVTIDQSFVLGMGPRITQGITALYHGFFG